MFSCHYTSEILTTAFHLPCKDLGERAYFFKALLNLHLLSRLYLKGYRAPMPLFWCFTVCVLSPMPWVCLRLLVCGSSCSGELFTAGQGQAGFSNIGFPLSFFLLKVHDYFVLIEAVTEPLGWMKPGQILPRRTRGDISEVKINAQGEV